MPVTLDRSRAWLEAAALVDLGDREATYWAGRATLCSCPDDLDRYDQVFEAFFLAREGLPRQKPRDRQTELVSSPLPDSEQEGGAGAEDADTVQALASATEVLRHRDIAEVTGAQKALLAAMFTALRPVSPRRRAHRRTAFRRGEVDAGRTLRLTLRRMGEPADIAWRRRRTRPRRVVLLVDVSGSMSKYADALLRLAHRYVVAADRGAVEVFTTGTRLTRVTRALAHRDPERALVAAGEAVPDWAGGTRLGENLKAFNDRWGQRGMARGAVVVVFSDGWERGDPALLTEQMARLHRMAHRVVWVNPHRGKAGYQPIQSGVLAALPHIDDFVAGHSLATFHELTEVISRA
ncbi:VWA domain-containing protein [Nocardioides sp.]|uniref:vWA domain-containing protein n=1 Tax=Nocardioides sp. TaxID=35761 RepID=UPI0035285C93